MPDTKIEEVGAILDKFKEETEDLWEQFMEGNDPDPQKYDDFLDNAYKQAIKDILALINRSNVEERIEENESLLEAVGNGKYTANDWCFNHEKYSSYCHACKTAKWGNYFFERFATALRERILALKDGDRDG